MKLQLEQIKSNATNDLQNVKTQQDIENFRVKYLGKKGALTSILKQMGTLSPEERPKMGQLSNDVRNFLLDNINSKLEEIQKLELSKKLQSEKIDVTLPGKPYSLGKKHPTTLILDEVSDIFIGMGFSIVEGPEIESDYYNFEALNLSKDHPARDTQDTFYIDENTLLRTQTSSVQIRTMQNQKPPIRIISPGKVYRSDEVDATHSPVFNQIEGLVVDKGITFSDLKGTLETFLRHLYGNDIVTRFRPHHFPYTEPSAELDLQCFSCHGKGCRLCKGEGFIEVLGCGMVHPKVLQNCGIDPEVYSGFAFGVGLERIAMRRYKIDDLRLFYENDARFLNQF